MKSADHKAYEELQTRLEEFMAEIQKATEKSGMKMALRDELKKCSGEYAVFLKDILLRSNLEIKTTEEPIPKRKDSLKWKNKKEKNSTEE